ncbi:A/G-specific adenine glycosylase [Holzapfeliella saturejae]|uniref:A/G-specific adenine glycosylase n=1 Tax=Holzapfeliella saturejae TaxID=3082953 RepID=UPI00399C6003
MVISYIEWSDDTIKQFRRTLLTWYDENKRDLPWRKDTDPYHVFISEIMLQQTQVNTVIDYYLKFIEAFPTVFDLAQAPEDELMAVWQGLGYYSRARNMQAAAKQIVLDYEGHWPKTAKELEQLKGIGPYTSCAIASIAFGEVEPAIDGNAFRVFARLLKIEDDIAKPKTKTLFYNIVKKIIDPDRPGDFNQAIMDLGSSYMKAKNPIIEQSPVYEFDASGQEGTYLDYPVKTKKKPPQKIPYYAFVIKTPTGYLLEKRPQTGILANFTMFPLIKKSDVEKEAIVDYFKANYSVELAHIEVDDSQKVTHTFTHQQWQINFVKADLVRFNNANFIEVNEKELYQLNLSALQKKMNNILA